MSLRSRILALEHDIKGRTHQIEQAHKLVGYWDRELAAAKRAASHVDHAHPIPRWGIDYAYGSPEPGILRREGTTFVCRYLGGDTNKDLTHLEAERLSGVGLDIVTVWEAGATNALSGEQQGARDAKRAAAQASQCGQPHNRPVYFAVDFDMQREQHGAVLAYFRGCADILGHTKVGVYGGYAAVNLIIGANHARYGWQTYAWSGGRWEQRAQLRQVLNDRVVAGVNCDIDKAVAADFGQWRI